MAKDFSTYNNYPLGLRNNNPGNLRYTASINWLGQTGSNKGFSTFKNISYGIRAWGMDLKHDIGKGANTIEKLIYQYAPPSENNTESYINNVVRISGIGRKQILPANTTTLLRLARGFFSVELGESYAKQLTDRDILDGLKLISGEGGANILPSIILFSVIILIIFLTYKYNLYV